MSASENIDRATFFDAHVHVHSATDVALMLDSAAANFAAAARVHQLTDWDGVLLLTEMGRADWFHSLPIAPQSLLAGNWSISREAEGSVTALAASPGRTMTILAGRQINTLEKLEVLAIGSAARVADGLPLDESIRAAQAKNALIVLPWAAGKWLGRRGELVTQALQTYRTSVFAGDNSGRPSVWPRPDLFRTAAAAGMAVLPGTDNLPIPGEERRVGAFGFWLDGELPGFSDGRQLSSILIERGVSRVRPFGRCAPLHHFVRTQVALRLHKS